MLQTTTNTFAIPDAVKERVVSQTRHLDMMPAIATQAMEISNDPECSISEFSTVVERDSVLATDILALANSAMYSPKVPVVSLTQAVFSIGFQQCRNMIMASRSR